MLSLFEDMENLFYTNPICVGEFIHLVKIGKVKTRKGFNIIDAIDGFGIRVLQQTKIDFIAYANLDTSLDTNRDPNDHQIIAQSISTKIPLISSDRKFSHYVSKGLNLIFNDRG